MTFLVDANIVIYAAVSSQYRASCLEIRHLELSGRLGPIRGLAQRTYRAFTPLLPVTDEIVARALTVEGARLGSNDRIHVATALANGIETIVSADEDFDRVRAIRRVDPLDDGARSRLVGAL